MKKASIFISIVLFALQASHAQSDKEMIWNLVISLDNTLVKKDSVKLKSMLTEDFIGVIPTGESFSRSQYIRFHCKPNVGLVKINEENQDMGSVHLYGNTAIVNRRVNVTKKAPDGSQRSFEVQRIEVCVKQQGLWYVAAGQGTEVLKKQ